MLKVCVHPLAENDQGGLSTCYTYGEEAQTAGRGKNDGSGTIQCHFVTEANDDMDEDVSSECDLDQANCNFQREESVYGFKDFKALKKVDKIKALYSIGTLLGQGAFG